MPGKKPEYFIEESEILYHFVVEGARLGCENCRETLIKGNGPKLIVTSQRIKTQNKEPLANDSDHGILNIPVFPNCSGDGSLAGDLARGGNIRASLSARMNNMTMCSTGGVCIPTVVDPWKYTKKDVTSFKRPTLLCDENDYTNSSRCFCKRGNAWIYVVSCGQHPNEADMRDVID